MRSQPTKNKFLADLLYFLGKIPIILTIFFLPNQPLPQAICIVIYGGFYMGIAMTLAYRRRISKFYQFFSCLIYLLCCVILVLLSLNINASLALDTILVLTSLIYLLGTFGQIVTNHLFFMSIYDYVLARFFRIEKSPIWYFPFYFEVTLSCWSFPIN